MSFSSPDHPETKCFWLTPECKLVQEDILHLASALGTAALAEYGELRPTLLRAIAEFRQHLHEHRASIEGPAGLFSGLTAKDPQLAPQIGGLCQQHVEIHRLLVELEQRLGSLDAGDPMALERLRQCAGRLAELMQCHRASGSRLAAEAAERPAGPSA